MRTGVARIFGEAPALSRIELLDSTGAVVGEVQADASGHFERRVALPVGRHYVRAKAIDSFGRCNYSRDLSIEIFEPQEIESESHESTPEEQYETLLRAVLSGYSVDPQTGHAILSAAGRTRSDFDSDIARLLECEGSTDNMRS